MTFSSGIPVAVEADHRVHVHIPPPSDCTHEWVDERAQVENWAGTVVRKDNWQRCELCGSVRTKP